MIEKNAGKRRKERDLVMIEKNTEKKYRERGPLLLTHFGFSGPAVLKLSAWGARVLFDKDYRFSFSINYIITCD